MSDTSQGEGWWRASDGKWYPPESHPDYQPPVAPAPEPVAPAPEPVAPAPEPVAPAPAPIPASETVIVQRPAALSGDPAAAVPPTAPQPVAGIPPIASAPLPGAPIPPLGSALPPVPGSGAGPAGTVDNKAPWFLMIGAGVLVIVGLLLPWVTVDGADGIPGIDTSLSGIEADDGKIMLVLALGIIGLAAAHMVTQAKWAFITLIVVVIAAIGLSVFEITDVTSEDEVFGLSFNVGIGLFIDLIASILAAAGLVWSRTVSS